MSSIPTFAAPWREAFTKDVKEMEMPVFYLASLHHHDKNTPDSPAIVPSVRAVIFRGFWGSMEVNPKNQAPLNPAAYDSDLLTITTDVRMNKVDELFSSTTVDHDKSGKGGPVEGVFWAEKAQRQWRIRGHSYVIAPDIDSSEAAPVRDGLREYMRPSECESGTDHWSWGKELTAHFGNLSPGMRGTFRNPPPGTPLTDKVGDGLGLGQKVTDLEDGIARRNFRVVIIVPEQVDLVDLSDPSRHRRWQHKLVTANNGRSWESTEMWP
ncbi:hypothetical protein Golomagni_08073 [Golovinomyces magnicellulatus]|nr:hypothetical protein Golomagni_08073 [Golovinomyces magnicellulatus]